MHTVAPGSRSAGVRPGWHFPWAANRSAGRVWGGGCGGRAHHLGDTLGRSWRQPASPPPRPPPQRTQGHAKRVRHFSYTFSLAQHVHLAAGHCGGVAERRGGACCGVPPESPRPAARASALPRPTGHSSSGTTPADQHQERAGRNHRRQRHPAGGPTVSSRRRSSHVQQQQQEGARLRRKCRGSHQTFPVCSGRALCSWCYAAPPHTTASQASNRGSVAWGRECRGQGGQGGGYRKCGATLVRGSVRQQRWAQKVRGRALRVKTGRASMCCLCWRREGGGRDPPRMRRGLKRARQARWPTRWLQRKSAPPWGRAQRTTCRAARPRAP